MRGAVRVQQGTRWTGGAQVGRGKAEESKGAAAPTVKQTLPREPAAGARSPHSRTEVLLAHIYPHWLRLWHLRLLQLLIAKLHSFPSDHGGSHQSETRKKLPKAYQQGWG